MLLEGSGLMRRIGLDMSGRFADADSQLLSGGNFGFMKFAEEDDIHEEGNTTAFERAVKRVFVVGHVWGYRTRGNWENANPDVQVMCLQANGGSRRETGDQNGTESGIEDGGGSQEGDGGENAAISLQVGPLLVLMSLMTVAFDFL